MVGTSPKKFRQKSKRSGFSFFLVDILPVQSFLIYYLRPKRLLRSQPQWLSATPTTTATTATTTSTTATLATTATLTTKSAAKIVTVATKSSWTGTNVINMHNNSNNIDDSDNNNDINSSVRNGPMQSKQSMSSQRTNLSTKKSTSVEIKMTFTQINFVTLIQMIETENQKN